MKSRISHLETDYSARGIPRYSVEVWHDGLQKHRHIKGADDDIVLRKAQMQMAEWDAKWAEVSIKNAERSSKEHQKQQAAQRTDEAKAELARLESLLKETLSVDDRVDWESLKDTTRFPEAKPRQAPPPKSPQVTPVPKQPVASDPEFVPRLGFFDKLLPSRKERKLQEAREQFTQAHTHWRETAARAHEGDERAQQQHAEKLQHQKLLHERAVADWEHRRDQFQQSQAAGNDAIDTQRAAYESGNTDAIVEYCDMVLSASDYPDWFPKEWDLEYNGETKSLVVDYVLPAPDRLPTLKEVRYVASKNETTEAHITQSQAAQLYDSVLYQLVLRTIHELYEADVVEALQAITFNGWVTSIDRASGKETTACVLSVQAPRAEFLAINLAAVDPKACFRALKGVGSSKLHSLSAVPPIMQIRRDDGRFVAAREVAETLNDSVNLAAMPWEDFEHLIREVFEREFSSSGGEVKITRASRDGGVDAVAFDPDPIRGGKIVIQAKRYTNTVGVSAVRDLYGTMTNERASKGILVSTSDYGPDAYAFAKDKPLVLLSGANLLHLLQKHGHSARIDLKEAKEQALRQKSG